MQALGVSWGDRKGRRRSIAMMAVVAAAVLPAPSLAGAPAAHKTVLQQVIVQATKDAGEIQIEAHKDGWDGATLTPATITIKTKRVEMRPAVS